MVKNKFFLAGLVLLALVILYYAFFDSSNGTSAGGLDASVDPAAYRQQVEQERQKKDESFRTGDTSPLPDRSNFKGLAYFAPDPSYRVVARLEPFADKTQKLVVRMSDGSEEVYDKFAHAVFSLNDEACRLLIVKLEDNYSILFRDATSGKETYGGGRYLDIDPANMADNRVLLDFNAAYNPYCAYNPTYSCPLPPAENTLPVAVRAGERYVAHE
ncbi:DUF1684 domain-containing protein [Spirosoma taeanense]|uniref:DUF1684 domain-containing protein n=1 Tax=Spirosoma taeanense TaxID=2735870 RepID=A0A6M5Y2D1_9BACT|nr:DUF1684 domain-containing protein [Spirosoma taeanense]QJW88828.1 DUF1684 domain-containing protein [Spirosoma taeanense]